MANIREIPLQPKQRQLYDLALNSPCSWIAYGGSRGGGKSGGLRRILLLLLQTFPKSSALLLRKTFAAVQKNHVLKYLAEFPELRQYYNVQDKIFNLPNGSRLHIGYGENKGDIEEKYQGQEFDWIAPEEATQIPESDLTYLRTCNRSTVRGVKPKMLLTCNPGNISHGFIKRLFVDRKFQENEDPAEFAPMLQAYGWDNVEWVREALETDGLTASHYYRVMTEDERREYFLTRSDYGKNLAQLKERLKIAHLWGRWDIFAGQYFDIWDEARHTYDPRSIVLEPYWTRWMGGDWGFAHEGAFYWAAEDPFGIVRLYREHVASGLTPHQLGDELRRRSEGETIQTVYLSPDAFAKRTSMRTIADELHDGMGSLPFPAMADNDRVGGATLIWQMLNENRLLVSTDCPRLIENIPAMIHDDDDLEDVLKVDGDDPYDGARYALKSRNRLSVVPREVENQKRLDAVSDPTSRMILARRLAHEREAAPAFARMGGRRGR